MEMRWKLSSNCHSCNHYYNHQLITPWLVRGRQHVLSQRQWRCAFTISSSSSSSSKSESESVAVVDGLDCLPNKWTPWLKLRPEKNGEGVLDCFYNPAENQVVRLNRKDCLGVPDTAMCFGVARDWLGFVDPTDDCPVYLTNPFFGGEHTQDVICLPSLATLPNVWGVERDPKTSKILQYKLRNFSQHAHEFHCYPYYICDHVILASIISHLAISELDPYHKDCVVMAIHGDYTNFSYTALWDDASRSVGWIPLEDHNPKLNPNQMVFSCIKKLFFVINRRIGILAFDLLHDLKKRSKMVFMFPWVFAMRQLQQEYEREESLELKDLRNACQSQREEYLVSLDNGDLLLIIRYGLLEDLDDHLYGFTGKELHWKTLHFDVFRVNFSEMRLERLTTLGYHSVFVGCNQSLSVWAPKFAGFRPNCIYFTNSYSHNLGYAEDCGIFDLDTNIISSVSYPYTPSNPHPNVQLDSSCEKGWKELFWVAPPFLHQ